MKEEMVLIYHISSLERCNHEYSVLINPYLRKILYLQGYTTHETNIMAD